MNPPAAGLWPERHLFGEDRSPGGALARILLAPASVAFEIASRARGALYDRGILRAERLPVPVVSVGNLTVGGTGKTPFVAWLTARFLSVGRHPAIVLRGYGARVGALPRRVAAVAADPASRGGQSDAQTDAHDGNAGPESDEALLLARRFPSTPVIAGRDRARGARIALAAGADTIVLDDGFQHRALARDLDIVLLDPRVAPGRGRFLPAGPFREPWSALARADLLAVVDGPNVAPPGGRPLVRAVRRALALRFAAGRREPPSSLRGRRVLALSGIGRPESFRALAESEACDVVAVSAFRDHHAFRPDELARVLEDAARHRAELVVTTEKDAARLPPAFLDRGDVAILEIELAIVEEEDALVRALEAALHGGAR